MLSKIEREMLQKLRQDRKREEKAYETLINHKTDWAFLEELIQRVNSNPDLEVSITTRDGTTIKLRTVKKQEIDPCLL